MEVTRAADRGKSLCEDSEAGRRWSERPAPSFVWSVLFEHLLCCSGNEKASLCGGARGDGGLGGGVLLGELLRGLLGKQPVTGHWPVPRAGLRYQS